MTALGTSLTGSLASEYACAVDDTLKAELPDYPIIRTVCSALSRRSRANRAAVLGQGSMNVPMSLSGSSARPKRGEVVAEP